METGIDNNSGFLHSYTDQQVTDPQYFNGICLLHFQGLRSPTPPSLENEGSMFL
jgi:hypothetical protein